MKRKILIFLTFLLLIISLIPYSTESIPEWTVKIVDYNGQPVSNIEVTQNWSSTSSESKSSETKISDNNGFVTFPPRKFFAPFLSRIFINFIEHINSIVMFHGSQIGGHSTIDSTKSTYILIYDEGDKVMPNELKIR